MKNPTLLFYVALMFSFSTAFSQHSISETHLHQEGLHAIKSSESGTVFHVVQQTMSDQQVLQIDIVPTSKPKEDYVYADLTFPTIGQNAVQFYLKSVSPRGLVRAEVMRFDTLAQTFIAVADRIISNKYVPDNWTYYTIDIPHVKNQKDQYRIIFSFNRASNDSTEPVSLLNRKSSYYLSDVRAVDFSISNGQFNAWYKDKWPAQPHSWHIEKGNGSVERTQGHLLDDYGLLIIHNDPHPLLVSNLAPISTAKARQLSFYARAEEEGQPLQVQFSQGGPFHEVKLSKKWRKYTFTILSLSDNQLQIQSTRKGRIYVDEFITL